MVIYTRPENHGNEQFFDFGELKDKSYQIPMKQIRPMELLAFAKFEIYGKNYLPDPQHIFSIFPIIPYRAPIEPGQSIKTPLDKRGGALPQLSLTINFSAL